MKYRKLRIVWSVSWGIVAVLLVALWVRSFNREESVWIYTPRGGVTLCNIYGKAILKVAIRAGAVPNVVTGMQSSINPQPELSFYGMEFYAGFLLRRGSNNFDLFIPYWFLTLLSLSIAPLAWLHRRFSLRTLLIVMTLLAVVFGLAVWMTMPPTTPPTNAGDFDIDVHSEQH
jgi:hypothetical protein